MRAEVLRARAVGAERAGGVAVPDVGLLAHVARAGGEAAAGRHAVEVEDNVGAVAHGVWRGCWGEVSVDLHAAAQPPLALG